MSAQVSRIGGIEELSAYWHNLAGGDVPARSQLDPAAIVPLLPYLYLVEFETDPFRVRYRLSGTATDVWNGIILAGRYLDEFLSGDQYGANQYVIESYEKTWRTGRPVTGQYLWPSQAGYTTAVRFGLFPLTIDGKVAQAISIEEFDPLRATDSWVDME